MRKTLLITLILLATALTVSAEQFKSTGTVNVYFSPNGGATTAVVRELDSARSEILVQAYSFTSKPIAKALVDAKKRGVKIEVVLDKSQRREKYTSADFVAHAGIPTYIDDRHAIAHNKIMIIDRQTLIRDRSISPKRQKRRTRRTYSCGRGTEHWWIVTFGTSRNTGGIPRCTLGSEHSTFVGG